MNDLSDFSRLLIFLYFNVKHALIIFILLHRERNGTEPVEQFFGHRAGANCEDRGFIEQRLRSTDFQDVSLVDDGYAVAECLHIGKLV